MRRFFLLTGALVLLLALVAACGDDDDSGDDTDIADDITVTLPDVEEEATEADEDVATATMDDGEATGTEDDADVTGTEADVDMTGTEDDADATMDEDATGTEEMDEDGTATEDDDMMTATEDDADATMDDDGTATEEDDDADSTADMAEGTATDDTFGIGDPITVGDLIITVNDAMVLDSGGVVSPDTGNQFLGVEMTVENRSTNPVGVSRALLQTHLEDEDGEEYELDLSATAVAIFSGGFDPATEIEPDTEITGVAGFQVPEDLSPEDLILVFDEDNGERIEVSLSDDSTQ